MDGESDGERSEGGDQKNKSKWKTLEHHGMTFPQAYQPLPTNVRVKNKKSGKAVDLNLEAEEAACWWSLDETKEFGQGTKVKENFWYEFKSMLEKVSKNCAQIYIYVSHRVYLIQ